MDKAFIIGAGRHAAVVLDAMRAGGRFLSVGAIDDDRSGTLLDLPVLGRLADLPRLAREHACTGAVVAIGANEARRRVAAEVTRLLPEVRWASVVHPSAVVSPGARIGPGAVILAMAVIGVGTTTGAHVIVNTRASLDHDARLGDFASLGPGATTGGDVEIGAHAYVAIGATVAHGVTIGEGTVVGAQSLVLTDCAPYSVYYGVPARRVRARKAEDPYL